jgi:hypothetical protein
VEHRSKPWGAAGPRQRGSLGRLAVALALAAPLAATAADDMATRHGKLIVRKKDDVEKVLYLERSRLPVADYLVSVERKFEIAERDVVLVSTGSGGNACPAMYVFVVVERGTAHVSDAFGNCSDIPKVSRAGDRIVMEFPGRPKSVATLDGLKLIEGKKPIKLQPVRF